MSYHEKGWIKFAPDPALDAWINSAKSDALIIAADKAMKTKWLRCGGTWFVGVNTLHNDADGAVDGIPLIGRAVDFIHQEIGTEPIKWDRAQVSVY